MTRMPWLRATLSLFLLLVALADPATAQRAGSDRGRDIAGVFDYYALVLSWSPTYCDEAGDRRRDPQCRPRRDRPYAFVLHGLWPQYERGFPNFCRVEERPFVPNRIINAMLDIMPARGLIIHQYRKHGVCSGLRPSRYFGASRKLFEFIRIPEGFQRPREPRFVTIEEVKAGFVAANPGLKEDMIGVSCRRGRGNQLREVRICFTPQGRLRRCGSNERQRRLCRADRLFVPPVRWAR